MRIGDLVYRHGAYHRVERPEMVEVFEYAIIAISAVGAIWYLLDLITIDE